MAFDKKLLSKGDAGFTNGKVAIQWTYGPSTDTLAVITASAYFDSLTNEINAKDYLYIAASDNTDIREFTSAKGVTPVTVASFITAGDLADNSVTTPKIVDGAVTLPKVALNALDASIVANLGDVSTTAGIPILFRVGTAGGVTANTDITMDAKVVINDVWVVNRAVGTVGDRIQVFNGANAISDIMNIEKVDTAITRALEMDASNEVISAAGTLRVTETDGGGSDSPPTTVYILAYRVA